MFQVGEQVKDLVTGSICIIEAIKPGRRFLIRNSNSNDTYLRKRNQLEATRDKNVDILRNLFEKEPLASAYNAPLAPPPGFKLEP